MAYLAQTILKQSHLVHLSVFKIIFIAQLLQN